VRRLAVVMPLVLGLSAVVAVSSGSPASAASNTVHVTTKTSVTARYHGTATVKPTDHQTGNVVVSKRTITVKKGRRTIVKNRAYAKLKPGKYKTTTRITYRTYTVSTEKRTETVKKLSVGPDSSCSFSAGCFIDVSCTVTGADGGAQTFTASCISFANDFTGTYQDGGTYSGGDPGQTTFTLNDEGPEAANVTDAPFVGTVFEPTIAPASDLYVVTHPIKYVKVRHYSHLKSTSSTRQLIVHAGKKVRTCATYADFKSVRVNFSDPQHYGDAKYIVDRKLHSAGHRRNYSDDGTDYIATYDYKTCTSGATLSVSFDNGDAYSKFYFS